MLPFLLALALALALTLPALPYSFAVFNANCVEVLASKQAKTAPTPFRSLDGATAPPYNYSFFRYEGKI